MQYVPAVYTSHVQGAPKNALSECCWSHSALAQTQVTSTPCVWKLIFGRFLLRLSLIKPSQVMFMVKFSSTALNFDYDFVLLVHFFWDTLYASILVCVVFHQSSPQFPIILTLKSDFVFIENVFLILRSTTMQSNLKQREAMARNRIQENGLGVSSYLGLLFRSYLCLQKQCNVHNFHSIFIYPLPCPHI